MNEHAVCIFGEVLFDHFPDGARVLGGAPFNVAWHLQAFAQAPHFISRVGRDAEGEQIRDAMRDWGMDLNGLQTDDELPTGRVAVSIADGEPSYDIVQPCAYDAIAAGDVDDWQLLYHGSLALRSPTSMAALRHLTDKDRGLVFLDVNLRPPWWRGELLHDLLQRADWVKLNGDELQQLSGGNGQDARVFVDRYGLQGLVLTHGARGAELLTADGTREYVEPAGGGDVVDTVGAGDAFASVVILGLLQQWPLATTLQRAQQFASRIVTRRGATVADAAFYRQLADEWQTGTA